MARGSRKQDVPPPEPPRNYAPRGIAALLAPVVRPAFRKRAPAAAHLLSDWDSLSGPELSALASPVKLAGGTLTLACAGPAALELQHIAPQIIARLNQSIGQTMVERLRFIQTASSCHAPKPQAAHPLPVLPPDGLPDGALGEALAKLYQGINRDM
jgi:hypothetical protein